jgi:hypothetical protein
MRYVPKWTVPATLALLSLSSAASAQRTRSEYGLAVEWRKQIGTVGDSSEGRRKGLSLRIHADVPWKRYFGWRLEGSYVQVDYNRVDALGSTPISETDFELGGYLRAFRAPALKTRPYLLAGAVGSIRGSCDLNNAFSGASSTNVRCNAGHDYLLGWAAGAGVRFPSWLGGWNWFVESRLLSNVTAARGGKLVVVSVGAGM